MLEEFPSDARASIVSFLDFGETWRFSILVTHKWKTLLENPEIWSETVVDLRFPSDAGASHRKH